MKMTMMVVVVVVVVYDIDEGVDDDVDDNGVGQTDFITPVYQDAPTNGMFDCTSANHEPLV